MCTMSCDECIGFPRLLLASFGEVKLKISLFGPARSELASKYRIYDTPISMLYFPCVVYLMNRGHFTYQEVNRGGL